MCEVEYSGKFDKDFKRMKKRGEELDKLRVVVGKLRRERSLNLTTRTIFCRVEVIQNESATLPLFGF
jgi:hypothetical protein